MPLQNRVTPFGKIVFSPQRGTFTGNRGVIHNANKEIVRKYALKAWITCRLEYKGAHREVMTPNRWTELFFWDEATAFAAGHRPCAYCRNADFKKFKSLWLKANREEFKIGDESMKFIDTILHTERMAMQNGAEYIYHLEDLPDGTMVCYFDDESASYLWWKKTLYVWGETKYEKLEIDYSSSDQLIRVLTPPSIINTFREGYVPQIAMSFEPSYR